MNIIIFAGGQGTRLWPASRAGKPKQFLKLVGDKTLLEQTYDRVKPKFKPKQVFIATSTDYAPYIKKQLPQVPVSNFSLEPARRNRGPALGLAVLIMQNQTKNDIFATAWSDDYIAQPKKYLSVLAAAGKTVKTNPNQIIAIGAKATSPSTAFCYIQSGNKGKNNLYSVKKFTDKPNSKQAQAFLKAKNYFWNTGYFVSTGSNILRLYQTYYPKSYDLLMKLKPFIGTKQRASAIKKYYPLMESFDFEEILRKDPSQLKIIAADFGWADVGRWSVIKDIQSPADKNLIKGSVITHETNGSLIYNYDPKKIVATLNLNDLVIINTEEGLLIADKDHTENLKSLIKILEKDKKLKKFL